MKPILTLVRSSGTLVPPTGGCSICGIPSRKESHFRCRQLVQKRKQYAEQAELARHMAEVAGEYVRARL